jgi:hypothetical protein
VGLLTPVTESAKPLGSVSLASSVEAAIVVEPFSTTVKPLSLLAIGGCGDRVDFE